MSRKTASAETKNTAIDAMAESLVNHTKEILEANKIDLENADGQRGTVWDNLRMYQKWVWKYAEIAKAIGHTSPDSTQIRIDWSRFVGASGKVRLSHRVWEKDDGTKETQADLKYIIPSADQTGDLAF